MKILITIYLLFLSVHIQSQWTIRPSGVTTNLRQVTFCDQNTGWAAGDGGVILKTTNGGTNWSLLNSGVTQDLYSILYRDSLNLVTCGSVGTILRSTNGGINWVPAVSGVSSILRSVAWYTNTTEMRAAGDNGVILLSNNNGLTWTIEASGITSQLNCIVYFSGPNTGYSSEVMGNGTKRYRFTSNAWVVDAGFSAPSENLLAGMNTSRFFSFALSFMCSEGGKVFKRRYGQGNQWEQLNSGVTTPLRSISDGNANLFSYGTFGKYLWVVGDNGVIRNSADTGHTWSAQTGASGINLNSICMIDTLRGCIVGAGGTILQTLTGGTIGIQQISLTVPGGFSLSQNYPNPFNPVTNIEFSVPKSAFVRLTVFDINGREVETLVDQNMQAGTYKADWIASKYSSGIYFYTINSGSYRETKKMILIK